MTWTWPRGPGRWEVATRERDAARALADQLAMAAEFVMEEIGDFEDDISEQRVTEALAAYEARDWK